MNKPTPIDQVSAFVDELDCHQPNAVQHVYSVTIPVKLYVTAPKGFPDGLLDSHSQGEIQVRAKRYVAAVLENRTTSAESELPEGWEVDVQYVDKASEFTRFLP